MSPDRWRQIEDIFQAAADLPADDRERHLQRACAGDAELRREVESLLGHDRPSSRIEEAIKDVAVAAVNDYSVKEAGERIGPYEIVEPIGKGGMGAVYLAVRNDDAYRKKVAIKIVKRGMDSDFVVHRFRQERQVLAGLEHPNIARLLDGGATGEGLPYFVLEYVPGVPITKYCEQHKLSTRDRIVLFRQVCAAVQYAHQNLIVHRDLKPGNILVTPEGAPKLLDFGIAKVLNTDGVSTSAATQTLTGMRLLTPEYASPEQVKGESITTASDVYSLGVILYELLAGKRPYQFRNYNPGHVVELVCDTQTERPSAMAAKQGGTRLRRQLSGDIDNIVLMALRKEPDRRYRSVEQFSEDLRRYLEGLPVIARKDTVRYRIAKFVQRNKLAVASALLLAATLVGGVVATLYQARVAARRFDQVRHLAHAFLFDFHDSIANLPGSTKARSLVVSKGLEYLDGLAKEAGDDLGLQMELARAYQKVGDVQGDPLGSNLGYSAGARASYQRSVDILEQLDRDHSGNHEVRRALVSAYTKLGSVLRVIGDSKEALAFYQRGASLADQLQAANPSRQTLRDLANILDYTARTLAAMGHTQDSLTATRKAMLINQRLLAASPSDYDLMSNLATNYATIGNGLARLDRVEEAVAEYRKTIEVREKLAALDPNSVRDQRLLMIAYSHLGDALGSPTRASLKDHKGALVYLEKMLAIAERLAQQDPNDRRLRMDLMFALLRFANVLSVTDRAESARRFREAARIGEEMAASDKPNATLQLNLAFAYDRLAALEDDAGNVVAALSLWRKGVAIGEKLVAEDAPNQDVRLQLVESAGRYAVALAKSGNRSEAMRYPEKLEKLALDLIGNGDANGRRLAQLPLARGRSGEMYEQLARHASDPNMRRNDLRAALSWYRRAGDAWDDLKRSGRIDPMYAGEPAHVENRVHELEKQ